MGYYGPDDTIRIALANCRGRPLLTGTRASCSSRRLMRASDETRWPIRQLGSLVGHYGLTGTAYFEVDPNDPLNAVIVDLDLSPRNASGRVEFSTPFFILKPVDMSRGNKKIFYTANNRGNDALLNVKTRADAG